MPPVDAAAAAVRCSASGTPQTISEKTGTTRIAAALMTARTLGLSQTEAIWGSSQIPSAGVRLTARLQP